MSGQRKSSASYEFRVYSIDLAKSVKKNKAFMERNSDYIDGKPCVYVGSTRKPVEVRYQEHKRGHKANRFAKRYGRRLRLADMGRIRPRKTRASIERKEQEVAEELQSRGWAVWWG